jgi:hypothetical protein
MVAKPRQARVRYRISLSTMPSANIKQRRLPSTIALARMANTPGPGVIPKIKIAIKKVIALSKDIVIS